MSPLPHRILSLFTPSQSPGPEGLVKGPGVGARPVSRHIVRPAPLPVWTRLYPAGAMVVHEGDRGDSLFLIVEGRVAVMRQGGGGAGRTVGQLTQGDFFGELALVAGAPRTASIMALERTVLLELSRAGLVEVGARHGLEAARLRMVCQERLVTDALRTSPLLAALPPELGMQLGSAFVPRVVSPGEAILTYRQPGDALYVLLRGRCSVSQPHRDGDAAPLPDLEEGAVFGEVSLLRSRLATATVRAETPCTLLRLERDVFTKYFRGQSSLRRALVKLGLARLRRSSRLEDAWGGLGSY